MSELQELWTWLRDPDNRGVLSLLVVVVVAGVGAFWKLYIHRSKKGATPTGGVTAGRDIVAGQVAGGDIFNIQFTPDQYAHFLQNINRELLDKLPGAGPEQRETLLREIEAFREKYANLEKAYEEQKTKLAEAAKALDDFSQDVAPDRIEKAKEALARGETGLAEDLFRQALDKSAAEAAEAAYQLGALAESRIDFQQARAYYEKAVHLQPDNPQYLNSAGLMALELGFYGEAEPFLKKALEIHEQALAPENPYVAASLSNLARLYRTQGKYAEAEPLYQRSLAIYKKTLGPEHPDMANSLNNLAVLYQDQGKYAAAEPLFQQALDIREQALGPGTPPRSHQP
jgi:tetratricopeptide (TPR) repeat protein